ncbi:InlB_B-repeat-containing protein [Hexamita inflata]|uniref:InlB B-repeat-containing protein n=1 Tax=Hexamita inflata TaxID=28002 RepID=A0AA86RLR4_9EUKA|nr:InlB B-repeat-containing protein [Hexamita inflata]
MHVHAIQMLTQSHLDELYAIAQKIYQNGSQEILDEYLSQIQEPITEEATQYITLIKEYLKLDIQVQSRQSLSFTQYQTSFRNILSVNPSYIFINNQTVNPNGIQELSELICLQLSNCGVRSLLFLFNSRLTNLRELHLQHNQIDSLDFLSGLNITTLNLSNNCVAHVSKVHLPRLSNLNLSGNKLSQTDFSHFFKLTHCDVSNNVLTSISLPQTVIFLNVSNNGLKSLKFIENLLLTHLYANGNKLCSLEPLYSQQQLQALELNLNQLFTSEELFFIQDKQHLKHFSVERNPMNTNKLFTQRLHAVINHLSTTQPRIEPPTLVRIQTPQQFSKIVRVSISESKSDSVWYISCVRFGFPFQLQTPFQKIF